MGFCIKSLIPLDIILKSLGIIAKKKCVNSEIKDIAKVV